MKKYLFYMASFVALSFFAFKGVNDDLALILKKKFEKYTEAKSPDKIFLHTDRDLFYKGETVWFKAYIISSSTRKLQENDGLLVLQLFNKNGNAVLEKKYKSSSGLVKAQLDLPDSLQGSYLMVAYNQWQLNFGQEYVFKKKIKIEAFQEIKQQQVYDTLDFDFQFFPEGGSLIENLESKVGFKATSSSGLGADAFGYLIRNGSDTLLSFNTEHAGIGYFIFTPESGNTYKAVVSALDITKEFSLPDAEREGYVLTVDNSDINKVNFNLRSSEASETPLLAGIFQNGKLSNDAVKTIAGSGNYSFSKKGLYPGVAVLTILDEAYKPVAERAFFIQPDLNAEVKIQINTPKFKPRKELEGLIVLSDPAGNPLEGDLSVSVVPERFSREMPQSNIIEYLLLSSEVRGDIENPGYYFGNYKNSTKAVDNLMLVQGWRKFNWKDIKNENFRLKFAREDKVYLKGRVYLIRDNQPFRNNSVTASVGGTDPYFQYIVLDDHGAFSIDASDIPDGQLYFQSTAPYEYGVKVVFEESTITSLENIDLDSPLDFHRENELRKVFAIYNSYDLLKRKETVVAVDKKMLSPPYDFIVDLDEFVPFNDMADVIKEIVPGVKVRKKKSGYDIKMMDINKKIYYKYRPLFIIDGVPVYDLQIVMNMDQSEVKFIEVLRSTERIKKYGHLGMGGVFQVRTRTGSFTPPNIEGIAKFDYKGIEKSKEFFTPKYKAPTRDNIPDFRNTLLWKPDVKIDKNGKSTFEFVFSDELDDIIIEVQGLTKDGIPVYKRQLIPRIRL